MPKHAIILHTSDNVATAMADVQPGDQVDVTRNGHTETILAQNAIPFGHKFALCSIETGSEVMKYGESIGRAVTAIRVGEHVHVHNLESARARGDLAHQKETSL